MFRLLAGLVLLSAAAVAAFPSAYGATGRVFPGVAVGGVNVGGFTAQEASRTLASEQERWELTPIAIQVPGGKEVLLTRRALGLSFPVSADPALSVGRGGDPLHNWAEAFAAMTNGRAIAAEPAGSSRAEGVAALSGLDTPFQRGLLELDAKDQLVVFAPSDGRSIDWSRLPGLAARDTRVTLPFTILKSPTDSSRFALARARAEAALAPHSLALDASDGAPAVARELAPNARRLLISIDWTIAGPVTNFNTTAATALLASFAKETDQAPTPAVVQIVNGKPAFVAADKPGRALDTGEALARLERGLFESTPSVALTRTASSSSFDSAAAQAWVAKATVLGTTSTDYDPAPRVVNILQAAKQLDQLLVMPDATFSFWDRIGEVSYARGFIDAGAIIDGVSSTALAGGICQVSTTLFGAVYRTGVPILERHHHDYYIHHYQLGMDATVFDPGADLVWKNDLPAPVLTHSYHEGNTLTFQIWGISTGRTVTLSTVDSNHHGVAPGQAADPAFPPGYVEIGRDVVVTRTVTEATGAQSRETLVSLYGAVWGGR